MNISSTYHVPSVSFSLSVVFANKSDGICVLALRDQLQVSLLDLDRASVSAKSSSEVQVGLTSSDGD